jgi:hypothetical protein
VIRLLLFTQRFTYIMKVHVRCMSLLNFKCLAPPFSLLRPTGLENTDFSSLLSHCCITHYKNITLKAEYFLCDITENCLNNYNFVAAVSFAPYNLASARLGLNSNG